MQHMENSICFVVFFLKASLTVGTSGLGEDSWRLNIGWWCLLSGLLWLCWTNWSNIQRQSLFWFKLQPVEILKLVESKFSWVGANWERYWLTGRAADIQPSLVLTSEDCVSWSHFRVLLSHNNRLSLKSIKSWKRKLSSLAGEFLYLFNFWV